MRFRKLVLRAVRLRCPLCGEGHMFKGYWKVNKTCSACGVSFEREPGYFLGSIYFNYGLTALIIAVAYPVLLFSETVPENQLLIGSLAFTIVFPMWFFRYARALWAGFDQFWDPRDGEQDVAESESPTKANAVK